MSAFKTERKEPFYLFIARMVEVREEVGLTASRTTENYACMSTPNSFFMFHLSKRKRFEKFFSLVDAKTKFF